jgi:hypothetical protein
MWRNATNASPPGALFKPGTQEPGDDSDRGVNGKDFLWENCILVINRNGDIIENWSQWDKILRRPHSVYISPYDPEKHVYIVDDYRHAIFKFTHDGKQLVKTIGTPNVPGSDSTHFYRPTFMAFNTDGSWYNSDGYINTRVVKFDKNDNYVTAWGEKGTNNGPNAEDRDAAELLQQRARRRRRHCDARGVCERSRQPPHPGLRQGRQVHPHVVDATWTTGLDLHFVYLDADRKVWVFDQVSQQLAQLDRQGHLIYAWGGLGAWPGALFGVHGISVDQEQNLYLAAVGRGGVQKFRPRQGANPALLVASWSTPPGSSSEQIDDPDGRAARAPPSGSTHLNESRTRQRGSTRGRAPRTSRR